MKNRRSCVVSIFLFLLLVGCSWSGDYTATPTETTPKLENRAPHIRGTVTRIYLKDDHIGSLFVEGSLEDPLDPDIHYEKAYIEVTDTTLVYRKQENIYLKSEVKDLSVNSDVEVLFTDPIHTSDPVQATAEEIVILK